ncbi:co-chaperone DjlA [Methylophaga sp. OBS4]|uniref:co-chaperone DjlA n=1 Tax=Methylophaga sp. OBS4 TaxID=2991935 RepID=UPI002259381B|nr:co-chaperone DjlA [Methylophaga sp. OBS4]MCX4187410.1 co-chaperone DjlA [Methylophaga sp. OBS4]
MFKWIGLIIGFYMSGIIGGLLGLFIGSIIDRARAFGVGGVNPLTATQRQAVFLETLFVLKGKLAKADGRISQDEIDHVEAFIRKLGMTAEHRQAAISQFKRGASPDFDITETLTRFKQHCGHTLNLRQVLLVYLTVMALADGKLDPSERSILEQVSIQLGYSPAEFNRILDMVLGQAHFSQPRADTKSALQDAYKALGVSADSSDQEIKRAYRKLMSQYHPDKLMGQGVPEDMIAVATEQTKEIQLAYDLIKKHRGN